MTVLYVCPLEQLDATITASQAKHMISLAGPGKSLERPSKITDGYLALEFNDIAEPREGLVAPSSDHVAQIISAVQDWKEAPSIVFQCWMGISRSTAAAIIAALVLNPKIAPHAVATCLRAAAPTATPNPLMIAHADALLGYEESLMDAVADIGRGADAFLGTPFHIDVSNITA